jgi:hypothetical protein
MNLRFTLVALALTIDVVLCQVGLETVDYGRSGELRSSVPSLVPAPHIAIESDTAISDDIVSLTHDPLRSRFTIVLNNTRSPFPVLRGRLSGPALVMLEWNNLDANSTHTSMALSTTSRLEGYYRAPVVGTYFLEILVIQRSDWKFSTHFEATCLENPRHNRITKRGVVIRVEHAQPVPIGYWVAKSDVSKPLYTRFQEPNCRPNSTDSLSDRCTIPGDLSRFENYEFHFQANNTLQAKEMLLKDKNANICYMGDSHSRAAKEFTQKLAGGRPTAATHLYFRHPHLAKPPLLKKAVANLNCTAVVVGIGAWPAAGQPGDRPHLFEEYRNEMSEVIWGIQNMTNVFVQYVHYHLLSDNLTACPPTDWRSPRVIDMYNEILSQVCGEHGVPFIDTNFLIGPIWDSPVDWSHFDSMGIKEVALYILSVAFGMDSV